MTVLRGLLARWGRLDAVLVSILALLAIAAGVLLVAAVRVIW